MSDEMFFSADERSLIRGKRIARRTETCRPCVVTVKIPGTSPIRAVVIDMNPYGMLVRAMEAIPVNAEVSVQLMRDDHFRETFSEPHEGMVVRHEDAGDGFTDHGVRLVKKKIAKASEKPITIKQPRPSAPTEPTRMHTIDITIGGPSRGRDRRS